MVGYRWGWRDRQGLERMRLPYNRTMPFPVYLKLGPLSLHPHALMETLAYAAGSAAFWGLRRRWRDPLEARIRLGVVAGAALGAGLGAKLLHALTLAPQGLASGWMPLLAGKSVLGALLGGHLGVEIAKRSLGERRRTGDLFVIPLCLGMAVGRVGCFLTGLADGTYGGPTSLPWGVDFGDGIPRHPTQLYEAALLLLFGAASMAFRTRVKREGDLWRLFLAAYCAWRFGIDFLKPYPPVFGLNAIQWAAFAALAALAWERWGGSRRSPR